MTATRRATFAAFARNATPCGYRRAAEIICPEQDARGDSVRPRLFQFAMNDRFIANARAQDFFDAAREPKEIRWYDVGHGLNADATRERVEWVTRQLEL